MMQAMLANGGEEPTLFLWASDKHPYPHPFRVPTMRPLEKGDMIICEMHPKFGGYFTHVERTFCLGKPEPRYLDIYEACLAAYRTRPRPVQAGRENLDGDGRGARRHHRLGLRHLRGRHPRPRPRLAGISALPPPCARAPTRAR